MNFYWLVIAIKILALYKFTLFNLQKLQLQENCSLGLGGVAARQARVQGLKCLGLEITLSIMETHPEGSGFQNTHTVVHELLN